MQRGTVKLFNNRDDRLYGFIVPDDQSGDVFFHFNNGKVVMPGVCTPILVDGDLPLPRKGDYVVFESTQSRKGPKAAVWAFGNDWEEALQKKRAQPDPNRGMPSWDEMLEVVDGTIGLQQGIMSATSVLKLSNEQVAIFVRNTPDGKKGEELWKEFRRRQADNGTDEYTFITFVREVLKEASNRITFEPEEPDFDPDNDQWGPPIAHGMSHEYD